MRLSGPVDAVKVQFRNRTYLLLSDRHNSTQGSCPGMCADISIQNKTLPGQDNCETVLHFLDRHLKDGVDFFLEASFVMKDAPKPILEEDGLQAFDYGDSKEVCFDNAKNETFSNFDYIDRMLYLFHDSFLRKKTLTQYPNSFLHYVDIRDVFLGTYNESGTREMISVNPFSGSIVVRAFRDTDTIKDYRKIYEEGKTLVRYILDHAWDYYRAYTTKNKQFPTPKEKGKLYDEFRKRLSRFQLLTSRYKGVSISRVAKQLFKLPDELRVKIETWAKEAFKRELLISETFYKEWTTRMEELFARDIPVSLFRAQFEPVRMHPISCLVALSSIIMDIYLLARSFYHAHNPLTIFYCGAAHIENHVQFFTQNGGQVLERSQPKENLERCIAII